VFWIAAIFAYGYTMGMGHPRPFSSNEWYNIFPFALLLTGVLIDRINDWLEKRKER
jgi:hypothetical protein